jgi:hypothetical protein
VALIEGVGCIIEGYLGAARQYFAAGDLAGPDRLNQRDSAYKREKISKPNSLAQCRAESAAAGRDCTLPARFDAIARKYQGYWGGIDKAAIEKVHAEWQGLPDRRQLARLGAETVRGLGPGPRRVFELGCLAGFNLASIRAELAEAGAEVAFAGLEPNGEAVAYANEHYPRAEIRQDGFRDLLAESGGAAIDVCLVSRVFMILHPDDVTETVQALRDRT